MSLRRRLIATVSVGIAVVGVGVSATLAAFDNAPTSVPSEAPAGLENAQASPGRGVASVDSDAVGAFKAFRRARTSADAALVGNLRALQGLYHPQQQYGANPSLARNVYSGPDGSV